MKISLDKKLRNYPGFSADLNVSLGRYTVRYFRDEFTVYIHEDVWRETQRQIFNEIYDNVSIDDLSIELKEN